MERNRSVILMLLTMTSYMIVGIQWAQASLCPNKTTLSETSGVITSPSYPRYYPANLRCSWKITARRGYRVRLFIEYMFIHHCRAPASCTCDYLQIKNGEGGPSGRMCGPLTDYVVYDSINESLEVLFVSDGSANYFSGFKATYTTQVKYTGLHVACSLGEFLTGSSGFFSSPNFPNNYPQYSRCTWNITVASGYIIKVSFLHFQLGSLHLRPDDRVVITNLASSGDRLVGRFLPDPVYSVGNSIQVTFTSFTNQYSGFNASYTAISFESLCPNEMTLNETTGVITTPYYPRFYHGKLACSWKITARKGKRVKLFIEDLYIKSCGQTCTCGYLEIQNGSFSSDGFPGGRMCGRLIGSVTFYSFYETLKVLFVNDRSWQKPFRATYTQQNYIVSTECSNYRFLNESNRARTYSSVTNICDANLYGWYRFNGEAGSQMPESCVDMYHCGADAPGWLNGSHPIVADGVVQRQVCFNHASCCHYSTFISVRNCGEFYVYKFNRPPDCNLRYCGKGLPLVPECSTYRILNESDRARTYYGNDYKSDHALSVGWYRFSGAAGNQMVASRVNRTQCNTDHPGWLIGSHPAVADGTVQRTVCLGDTCYWSIHISVRNCGSFYVYKLKPLPYFARYCGYGNMTTTSVTPEPTTPTTGKTRKPTTEPLTPTTAGVVGLFNAPHVLVYMALIVAVLCQRTSVCVTVTTE